MHASEQLCVCVRISSQFLPDYDDYSSKDMVEAGDQTLKFSRNYLAVFKLNT